MTRNLQVMDPVVFLEACLYRRGAVQVSARTRSNPNPARSIVGHRALVGEFGVSVLPVSTPDQIKNLIEDLKQKLFTVSLDWQLFG
jgi:hypothetical protein